jgi:hypothetical protein
VQLVDLLVGEVAVHLRGPVEVVHDLLHEFAAQLVAVDDLAGVADDAADTQHGPERHRHQQGQDEAEAHAELALETHILPAHDTP